MCKAYPLDDSGASFGHTCVSCWQRSGNWDKVAGSVVGSSGAGGKFRDIFMTMLDSARRDTLMRTINCNYIGKAMANCLTVDDWAAIAREATIGHLRPQFAFCSIELKCAILERVCADAARVRALATLPDTQRAAIYARASPALVTNLRIIDTWENFAHVLRTMSPAQAARIVKIFADSTADDHPQFFIQTFNVLQATPIEASRIMWHTGDSVKYYRQLAAPHPEIAAQILWGMWDDGHPEWVAEVLRSMTFMVGFLKNDRKQALLRSYPEFRPKPNPLDGFQGPQ